MGELFIVVGLKARKDKDVSFSDISSLLLLTATAMK